MLTNGFILSNSVTVKQIWLRERLGSIGEGEAEFHSFLNSSPNGAKWIDFHL
jgi:hypothetical protein